MILRYNKPGVITDADGSTDGWEHEVLPIGNGSMGATLYGQVGAEQIVLNEDTLWTGGPGTEGYNYGNPPADLLKQKKANLKKIQETIDTNGSLEASQELISSIGHPKAGYGNYQNFGILKVDTPNAQNYTQYERHLDIDQAVAGVQYNVGQTQFKREAIASYPAGVIAQHISANQGAAVNFHLTYDRGLTPELKTPQALSEAEVKAEGNAITLSGKSPDNGLQYYGKVQVVTEGGTVTAGENGDLTVKDADSATIIWAGGTNYAQAFPNYRTQTAPKTAVDRKIARAAATPFATLRAEHVQDYQHLFNRVKLDLNAPTPNTTTEQLVRAYQGTTDADRYLETLYFQYGRYLLISSSREGSQPANLQGVWTRKNNPPWSADFHSNINLQMNYWPALTTNLAETYDPYLNFTSDLAEAGQVTAKELFDARGWVVMNETNPWGFTGVFDWPTASWYPEANAWLAQGFYQRYLYSNDKTFLRDRAYPMLKATSEFYQDFLREDPRDGSLVLNPSYSPEHGYYTAGAAMSQQIITELFTSTLAAATDLGVSDSFTEGLAQTLKKTDKGLRVHNGKVQEWKDPALEQSGEPHHRHTSHLYALFPGEAISPATTPELADAAKGTLQDRGDGGTGWSKAWKVNFWARLGDGDHAHLMLRQLLTQSTYPNLWDVHPPFQIDGNFGGTSGVAQMLLHGNDQVIDVLPALPGAWRSGSVSGLRAPRNVTVNTPWKDGQATTIEVHSQDTQTLSIRTALAQGPVVVRDADDNEVKTTRKDGVVKFEAQADTWYTLTGTTSLTVSCPAQINAGQQAEVAITTQGISGNAKLRTSVPQNWQVSPAVAIAPRDVQQEGAEPIDEYNQRALTKPARFSDAADGAKTTTVKVRAPEDTAGTAKLQVTLEAAGDQLVRECSTTVVDTGVVPMGAAKVVAWDSQATEGEARPSGLATAAIDGDPQTYWHTRWTPQEDAPPHYLVVDLGKEYDLTGAIYTPRQTGAVQNGQIGEYEFKVATDTELPQPGADDYGTPAAGNTDGVAAFPLDSEDAFKPVAQGQWPNAVYEHQRVDLEADGPVKARYVMLKAGADVKGQPFTHVAELNFRQQPEPPSAELEAVPEPDYPKPATGIVPGDEPSSNPSGGSSEGPSAGPSDGSSEGPAGGSSGGAGTPSTPAPKPTTGASEPSQQGGAQQNQRANGAHKSGIARTGALAIVPLLLAGGALTAVGIGLKRRRR